MVTKTQNLCKQNTQTVNIRLKCHEISFKGGYLDFSHLTEVKNMYITEIYMKKQHKSSITKNHKIEKKIYIFDGVRLKGYVASYF